MNNFIKKIWLAVSMLTILTIWVFAAWIDIEMKNNIWMFDVSNDSILIWITSTWTTVKEMIPNITINGTKLEDDKFLSSIDVRYMSWQVDKKVFSLDDKLNAWNKVYILFQSTSEGWLIGANAQLSIETKNLILSEYGKVSNWNINSYTVLWKVSYVLINNKPSKIEKTLPIIEEPKKEIDTALIEEKKTWIFDHIWIIALFSIILIVLFILPNKKFVW